MTPKEMADRLDRAQTVLDHAAALLDDEAEILLFSQSAPAGLREWPEARFEEPAEAADGRLFDDLRSTARSLRTLGSFIPRKEAP